MKKIKLPVIALLICIASVFALTACNFNLENADYTEDLEASDQEGSVELINAFFEGTLKDPDFVVTRKNKDGEVQYTETVKGTDSYMLTADGSQVYAYKKGDIFYVASISQVEDGEGNTTEQRYYWCSDSTKPGYYEDSENSTMEDVYNGSYCSFMSKYDGVNIVSMLPEDMGTYNCKSHSEKKDGITSGSLEFNFTAEEGTITITAASEENKVKTLQIVTSDGADATWTFVYGGASIELPDTDAWDEAAEEDAERMENNEKAIDARNEFFTDTTCAENVVVTVSVNGETSYVQSIANGMECLDFGTYKVYSYMKEKADGEYDYYYVYDGEDAKYYLINDDAYDDVVMMYYNNGICLYDEVGEQGAALACTTEGDTLTLTISLDGETLATLVATKTGDTVSTATYTVQGDDGSPITTTYSFAYGSANLTEPDLTGFVNSSASGEDN